MLPIANIVCVAKSIFTVQNIHYSYMYVCVLLPVTSWSQDVQECHYIVTIYTMNIIKNYCL